MFQLPLRSFDDMALLKTRIEHAGSAYRERKRIPSCIPRKAFVDKMESQWGCASQADLQPCNHHMHLDHSLPMKEQRSADACALMPTLPPRPLPLKSSQKKRLNFSLFYANARLRQWVAHTTTRMVLFKTDELRYINSLFDQFKDDFDISVLLVFTFSIFFFPSRSYEGHKAFKIKALWGTC